MDGFEWKPLIKTDPERIKISRLEAHHAIQNVSAVGRRFLPALPNDQNAELVWVPGLSRLAGKWVKGNINFRSSINLESYEIFLVDEKINTIASYDLKEKTQKDVMLWLEEQIGKLGLPAPDLTLHLPYTLPSIPSEKWPLFERPFPSAVIELSKIYHNTYVTLREIKHTYDSEALIAVRPKTFNMVLTIVLKNSGSHETDTRIVFGMSPGDEFFENPYFFVITWPHVDTASFGKMKSNGIWVSEEWTGAVLLSKHLYDGDQQLILREFYQESSELLIQHLLN